MNRFFKGIDCNLLLIAIICLFLIFPKTASAAKDEAILAGGCFWCLEHDLESLNGILSVESGYSGGQSKNPTYEMHYGHQEVVRVVFEDQIIKYQDLLKIYLRNVDPFDNKGQFCDRGESYKPVIFVDNPSQEEIALKSLQDAADELEVPISRIKVSLKTKQKFWIAEEYHQNFAKRNKFKYQFYRYSCGRDKTLEDIWGKDS